MGCSPPGLHIWRQRRQGDLLLVGLISLSAVEASPGVEGDFPFAGTGSHSRLSSQGQAALSVSGGLQEQVWLRMGTRGGREHTCSLPSGSLRYGGLEGWLKGQQPNRGIHFWCLRKALLSLEKTQEPQSHPPAFPGNASPSPYEFFSVGPRREP